LEQPRGAHGPGVLEDLGGNRRRVRPLVRGLAGRLRPSTRHRSILLDTVCWIG
jgi:hypothetical protein